MRIKIDWQADVMHVVFDEEAEFSLAEEAREEVVLDLDESQRIVGFEVQGISAKCSNSRNLLSLEVREQTRPRNVQRRCGARLCRKTC